MYYPHQFIRTAYQWYVILAQFLFYKRNFVVKMTCDNVYSYACKLPSALQDLDITCQLVGDSSISQNINKKIISKARRRVPKDIQNSLIANLCIGEQGFYFQFPVKGKWKYYTSPGTPVLNQKTGQRQCIYRIQHPMVEERLSDSLTHIKHKCPTLPSFILADTKA